MVKIASMYTTYLLVSCCMAQAHLKLTQAGLITLDPPTSTSMLALQACYHHDSPAHAHTYTDTHKQRSGKLVGILFSPTIWVTGVRQFFF